MCTPLPSFPCHLQHVKAMQNFCVIKPSSKSSPVQGVRGKDLQDHRFPTICISSRPWLYVIPKTQLFIHLFNLHSLVPLDLVTLMSKTSSLDTTLTSLSVLWFQLIIYNFLVVTSVLLFHIPPLTQNRPNSITVIPELKDYCCHEDNDKNYLSAPSIFLVAFYHFSATLRNLQHWKDEKSHTI